ncbi:hypothetical protein PIB30_033075 [Stylosanthes scabra]|uniref:Uncharacterized protein n=1 Tax=Stylosanthes scabra TaxID=79078 RepID=A0ABU6QC06_9FABA|nr:hypothetical protein [Stylosanthes scabra]
MRPKKRSSEASVYPFTDSWHVNLRSSDPSKLHKFGATILDMGPTRPNRQTQAPTSLLSPVKVHGSGPRSNRPSDSHARNNESWNVGHSSSTANRSLDGRAYLGYIKGRSALPSGTSSKPYPIAVLSKTPKSLFGDSSLAHCHSLTSTPDRLPWHPRLLRKSQTPLKKNTSKAIKCGNASSRRGKNASGKH